MRATRRNFVVEYKNRSRQTKMDKPASIWGDTDLKAVARQVEEQSAHLYPKAAQETIVDEAVSKGLEFESDRRSQTVALDARSQINEREIAQPATEALAKMTIAEDRAEDVLPPSPAVASPDVKRTGEKPAHRRYVRQVKTLTVENDGVFHVSRADLDKLQEENTRLKSELRKRLSADNQTLRQMLKRFC